MLFPVLRIVADKAIDMNTFKKKLEKFIGVDRKYMKLFKGSEGEEISLLRTCRDDDRVTIKLERVLTDGEQKIAVNHLIPNSKCVSFTQNLFTIIL